MAKSILQDRKECYFTKVTGTALHKHHIYEGKNRQISEREGFWVYLVPWLHNMSDEGVHFNKERDLILKRRCQAKYEETHTREEFLRLIGRSYLDW